MFHLLFVYSFVFLFLENYGVRKLEAVFAVLIATMALSFAWMFGDTKPSGKELLIGTFFLNTIIILHEVNISFFEYHFFPFCDCCRYFGS